MSMEQVTNINLEQLLDQLRARFRNRIAELEDESSLQIASLEVGIKKVARERDDLARQVEELKSLLAHTSMKLDEATTTIGSMQAQIDHGDPAPALCTCENYTGTERNAKGEKVCERCGKPVDAVVPEPGAPA